MKMTTGHAPDGAELAGWGWDPEHPEPNVTSAFVRRSETGTVSESYLRARVSKLAVIMLCTLGELV